MKLNRTLLYDRLIALASNANTSKTETDLYILMTVLSILKETTNTDLDVEMYGAGISKIHINGKTLHVPNPDIP